MAEPIEATVTDLPSTEDSSQSRLQRFTVNHPKTAKVVGIVAITAATMGVISVVKNRRQIVAEFTDGEEVNDSFDDSSETA